MMGNNCGQYGAKPNGFVPDRIGLHNIMLPHGPDKNAFKGASNAKLGAEKLENTMSLMFEIRFPQHLTELSGKEIGL
jgi:homogentisate 1,2-dioxygenase